MDAIDVINWVASGSGIVAALMVSLNSGEKITGLGFVVFTFSSVLWVTGALIDDETPLAVQNLVLFAINLYGIYRYLWRPARNRSSSSGA